MAGPLISTHRTLVDRDHMHHIKLDPVFKERYEIDVLHDSMVAIAHYLVDVPGAVRLSSSQDFMSGKMQYTVTTSTVIQERTGSNMEAILLSARLEGIGIAMQAVSRIRHMPGTIGPVEVGIEWAADEIRKEYARACGSRNSSSQVNQNEASNKEKEQ